MATHSAYHRLLRRLDSSNRRIQDPGDPLMLDRIFTICGIDDGPSQIGSISVELRLQFGLVYAYPKCANSRAFADIARTKTLSKLALDQIRALGYVVNVTQRTLSLGDVK